MRKTLLAAALVLALCCSALAGDIHTPPVAPDPPPGTSQELSVDAENNAPGGLTQIALDLLTLLPSLL